MRHDIRAFLWDVQTAADLVACFIDGRTFADYQTDALLRSAVERQIGIVGEALNRLSREAPDVARRISDIEDAVGMRNILIHGYGEVRNETVWQTARESLPALRSEACALLDELGPPGTNRVGP